MKKFLQFSGLIALALAVVGLVLMMVTHSVVYTDDAANNWYSGVSAIFGGGTAKITVSGFGISISSGVTEVDAKLAWCALLGWIFALVAILVLALGALVPVLKVKALVKWGALLNFIAVGLLVVAGVFLFFTVSAFATANEWSGSNGWGLGAGWVIAAILFIAGGVVAMCPTVVDLLGKK